MAMTRIELIEHRLAKATQEVFDTDHLVAVVGHRHRYPEEVLDECRLCRDADLIAHAPGDLRYLLSALKEAEAQRDGWRKEAEQYCSNAGYWRGRAEKAESQVARLREVLSTVVGVLNMGLDATTQDRDRAVALGMQILEADDA